MREGSSICCGLNTPVCTGFLGQKIARCVFHVLFAELHTMWLECVCVCACLWLETKLRSKRSTYSSPSCILSPHPLFFPYLCIWGQGVALERWQLPIPQLEGSPVIPAPGDSNASGLLEYTYCMHVHIPPYTHTHTIKIIQI